MIGMSINYKSIAHNIIVVTSYLICVIGLNDSNQNDIINVYYLFYVSIHQTIDMTLCD